MENIIRLLYAEDDPDWAFSIKKLLEINGFEIDIAENGDVAWEKFSSDHPDMVLLDVDMPGRNGWELIREFKRANEWIPIVLYSSFYDSKRLEEAFGVGAEDFISKSCFPEELADRLKALYLRAVKQQYHCESFTLSSYTTFHATSGILFLGNHKEVLKLNEARLLTEFCRHYNQNIDKEELCEAVWGKGMIDRSKQNALKNLITNLRKILYEDSSLKIINKRWSGYCLISL